MTFTPEEMYLPISPDLEGEWFTVTDGSLNYGFVWTDHEDGFGYQPLIPETNESVRVVVELVSDSITAAAALQLSTSNAYKGVLSTLREKDLAGPTGNGPLSDLLNTLNSLRGSAGDSKVSNYTASIDEDGYVTGLGFTSEEGIQLVREKSDWVPLTSNSDPRFYNDSFFYVNEDAIAFYDSKVAADKVISEDEFSKFAV